LKSRTPAQDRLTEPAVDVFFPARASRWPKTHMLWRPDKITIPGVDAGNGKDDDKVNNQHIPEVY